MDVDCLPSLVFDFIAPLSMSNSFKSSCSASRLRTGIDKVLSWSQVLPRN